MSPNSIAPSLPQHDGKDQWTVDNGCLTKAQIDEQIDNGLPVRRVSMPYLGGNVSLKALTAPEYLQVGKASGGDDDIFAVHLVAASIVDGDGERMYGTDDIAAISANWPWAVLRPLFEEALDLNGQTIEAVEGLVKNSDATPPNDSGTSSPSSPGS